MEKAFSLGIQITQMKLNILISNFKLLINCKREKQIIKQKGEINYDLRN